MRNASKIVLTVAVGGAMLGTVLSRMAEPVMQFAAAPDWRARFQTGFSATPLQSVDTGPQDLQPFGWTPGLLTAASAAEPLPVFAEAADYRTIDYDRIARGPDDLGPEETALDAEAAASELDRSAAAPEQPAPAAPPPAPAAQPAATTAAAPPAEIAVSQAG